MQQISRLFRDRYSEYLLWTNSFRFSFVAVTGIYQEYASARQGARFCLQEDYVRVGELYNCAPSRVVSTRDGSIWSLFVCRADDVSSDLIRDGFDCQSLHGDRDQSERERALKEMREGLVRILVATDVASRGLDIENVT